MESNTGNPRPDDAAGGWEDTAEEAARGREDEARLARLVRRLEALERARGIGPGSKKPPGNDVDKC